MTPFEIAINTELEGEALYRQALENAQSSMAREIFSYLIAEEQRHMATIESYVQKLRELGSMPESPAKFGDIDGLKTVFSDALKHVEQALPEDADDMQAIQRAMQFEQRGEQYYQRAAQQAQHENERDFFAILAREEHWHYLVLLDSYEALKDPQAWQEGADKIGLDGA
ncbi:MAG: ferritin family protein [Candidatus Alcyoniella australis]|nr:ferritin family protein [Candidatus Alcyoniella australis]